MTDRHQPAAPALRRSAVALVGMAISVASLAAAPHLPTLPIRLYDTVGLPAATSAELLDATEAALARSSITIGWLLCSEWSTTRPSDCTPTPAPGEVVVRVIQHHGTRGPTRCGFALTAGSGFVSLSSECASRTARLLRKRRGLGEPEVATEGEVLGYTLAHELAHVLLPGASHSFDGLFRARLHRRHWNGLRHGRLSFIHRDIERLREAAIRRQEATDSEVERLITTGEQMFEVLK